MIPKSRYSRAFFFSPAIYDFLFAASIRFCLKVMYQKFYLFGLCLTFSIWHNNLDCTSNWNISAVLICYSFPYFAKIFFLLLCFLYCKVVILYFYTVLYLILNSMPFHMSPGKILFHSVNSFDSISMGKNSSHGRMFILFVYSIIQIQR